MDEEPLPRQVDALYLESDRLLFAILNKKLNERTRQREYWEQQVTDAQTALDYANRQLEGLTD